MNNHISSTVTTTTLPSREEREQRLKEVGYNVFNLDTDDIFIDLLTDSGTGSMSRKQWAALMEGDEAYAGSTSFRRLEAAVQDIMGIDTIIPAHQGRGAENLLYGVLVEDGDHIPNNTHFDTTRAHIANQGGNPVDCPVEGAMEIDSHGDFRGNIDLQKVQDLVDRVGADKVPAIVLTLTNNSIAGQPVSMQNIEETQELADEIDARLVIDACRCVENAYFIKQREDGYSNTAVRDIVRKQLEYADAITMSGKKNGLVNMGGFVGIRDTSLKQPVKERGILYEGYTTYGGMSGRAMEAMAQGLREAVQPAHITSRVEQVQELGRMLQERDIPIYTPVGGHAVYIDAGEMLPHIPRDRFPGQALVAAFYREGGIRTVELGGFAFKDAERPEFVRLALPPRTYHQEHLEHI
ncbi:MAG: tryptophanase, partial [Candidatus Nanohaloarchaea archaeon]|nr:tryptophanase [Candidatus Nanohaloarchaea archaeon]